MYLSDCLGMQVATPLNTVGIGSPMAPSDALVGSGDILVANMLSKKNKRKKRRIKHESKEQVL